MLTDAAVIVGLNLIGAVFIWWINRPALAGGMEHPEYWSCEANGHNWKFAGRAEDGTTFYRCTRCGATSEN